MTAVLSGTPTHMLYMLSMQLHVQYVCTVSNVLTQQVHLSVTITYSVLILEEKTLEECYTW